MAIVRFRPKKNKDERQYHNKDAVQNAIHYILRPDKTWHNIIGGIGATINDEQNAIDQFMKVKRIYRNTKGKQILHFWVSFEHGEVKQLNDYLSIGYEIADFFDGQYQIVFSLHEDTEIDHIHFVVNTVSFSTGKKIRWKKGSWHHLQNHIDNIMKTREFYR